MSDKDILPKSIQTSDGDLESSQLNKNIYDDFRKMVKDYERSRRDYELYQHPNRIIDLIKEYYEAIAKLAGHENECNKKPLTAVGV